MWETDTIIILCEQIGMEFCGGGSVSDLEDITDEPLTEEQIGVICREALRGLEYIHSQKKIHRDIKAGNILLTKTGDIKLGMARIVSIFLIAFVVRFLTHSSQLISVFRHSSQRLSPKRTPSLELHIGWWRAGSFLFFFLAQRLYSKKELAGPRGHWRRLLRLQVRCMVFGHYCHRDGGTSSSLLRRKMISHSHYLHPYSDLNRKNIRFTQCEPYSRSLRTLHQSFKKLRNGTFYFSST